MSTLDSGDTIGRYRILRQLGAGAMGRVYLAEDPRIERQLAIKTVKVEGEGREVEERKRRLLREAKAAGRLLHPHVVTLFDAGEDGETLFLAFEYVPGMDLAQRLAAEPPLTVAEALRMVRQAAEGLDFAHRQGVVHRDIKPSNILIDTHGEVKVSDFGIAKMAGQATELTMTGSVVGSPHYLSPEQIRGEDLDGRSDIFSLGVVLYELLTSRRPFEAETLTTLIYQILHNEPPSLAGLLAGHGARIEALVVRMMAKDPAARFATAGDVAAEIASIEASLPAAAGAQVAAPAPATPPAVARAVSPSPAAVPPPAVSPSQAVTEITRPPGGAAPAPAGAPAAAVHAATAPSATTPQPSRKGLWVGVAAVAVAAMLAVVAGGYFVVRRWAERSRTVQEEGLEEGAPRGGAPETSEAMAPAATGPAGTRGKSIQGMGTGGTETEARESETGPQPAATPPSHLPAEQPPTSQPGTATETRPRQEERQPTSPPATSQRPPSLPAGTATTQPRGSAAAPPSGPAVAPTGRRPEPAPPPSPAAPVPAPSTREPAPTRAPPPVDREMATGLNVRFQADPADAFVLVDGTVVGRASELNAAGGYALPGPGDHLVVVRKPGRKDARLLLKAEAKAGTTTVPVRLAYPAAEDLAIGDLQLFRVQEAVGFKVDPKNAQVLVDGVAKGPASSFGGLGKGWLHLERGLHRLSLVAPGRRRVDVAVEVSSGASEKRQKIELTLPPEEPR